MTATIKNHPSKAQFDDVKADLSGIYGSAYFLIDGYLICACIRQVRRKLCIIIYVNGWVRGGDVWMGKESALHKMPVIARKFFCLTRRGQPTALIEKWERAIGKRKCQKEELWLYEKQCMAWNLFPTEGAFIAHIKKHNDSIVILDYQSYTEALTKIENGDDYVN